MVHYAWVFPNCIRYTDSTSTTQSGIPPAIRIFQIGYLLTHVVICSWKIAAFPNDECHNFVLCLTIRWTMIKKGILFANRPDGRLVFLTTKSNRSPLHFVTLVGFGFIYGCATILRLKNAEVMVGIPSIYRPPSRMSCAVL